MSRHLNTNSDLPIPDVQNYASLVLGNVEKYGDNVIMRTKRNGRWMEITWRELDVLLRNVAKALLELGVQDGDMISIFSPNKPECTIVDVATLSIRGVPVYIYPTSTPKQAAYIVHHSESKVIFTGTQEQFDKAAALMKEHDGPKALVALDDAMDLHETPGAMHWHRFLALGEASRQDDEIEARRQRSSIEDLVTLIYTSGTTGEPKGVMLTHANILYAAASHDRRLLHPGPSDVSLCFLPLSHVFERVWTYYTLYHGMVNHYLEDPKEIISFIQEVKPTIMCAVPRFYEKIYATVFHRLESSSPLKKRLFHWAVQTGRKRNGRIKDEQPVPRSLAFQYALADRLVLKKIRDVVGGRIRFFPCAGAPLSQEIEEFFYAAGIFICYGYGLSETTATVTCHEPSRFRFGLVGKPMPGVEVKIGKNDEILVRGNTVMKGYYKKPEETAAVFEDGWFKTGDAGRFEDNGELRITERIKELMKTSGGKYIAPQLIEAFIGSDHFIEQAAVIADNRKFVSALIVPEFESLFEYARKQQIPFTGKQDLIAHPDIVAFYEQRIADHSRELANFEQVIRFTLLAEEFTVDSGEITPTMKLKRKVIDAKHQQAIDAMYRDPRQR